jgi:hypothetical protein
VKVSKNKIKYHLNSYEEKKRFYPEPRVVRKKKKNKSK